MKKAPAVRVESSVYWWNRVLENDQIIIIIILLILLLIVIMTTKRRSERDSRRGDHNLDTVDPPPAVFAPPVWGAQDEDRREDSDLVPLCDAQRGRTPELHQPPGAGHDTSVLFVIFFVTHFAHSCLAEGARGGGGWYHCFGYLKMSRYVNTPPGGVRSLYAVFLALIQRPCTHEHSDVGLDPSRHVGTPETC